MTIQIFEENKTSTRFLNGFSEVYDDFDASLEDDNSPHSTPIFRSGYGLSDYNNLEETYNKLLQVEEPLLLLEKSREKAQEKDVHLPSDSIQNFEQIPTELLMQIFLHIFPDKVTFLNLSLVCKHWQTILSSDHYWKKSNKLWLGGPRKGLDKKKTWKEFVLSSASHWAHSQLQEDLLYKFQNLKKHSSIGNYISWFWSCEKGHIELVKRLLYGSKGHLYLNARDKRGRTALYHSARNGHHHIVHLLLSHFPIKNSTNNHTTHFHFNHNNNNNNNTLVLDNLFNNNDNNNNNIINNNDNINDNNNVNTNNDNQVNENNDNNNNNENKMAIEINCKLCDGTTPLLSACQHGHYRVVKLLLKYKADVNESRNSGASPLYLASQEGHSKVVKLLLKSAAEVDTVRKAGATPLYIASQNGHLPVVNLLIKWAANVDKKRNSGTTPLHVACHEGNIDVVKRLLQSNADVNNPRDSGQTCLFIACYHGNLPLVKLLLQYKPNVNTQPSPLVVACQRGEYQIVKLLLKAGADPNMISNNVTPLVIACQFSMLKIVSLLLKYKANPNIPRLSDNITPLSIACQYNAFPIVKKLIQMGANPNFAPNGELPLHISIFNSSYPIVKFLLSPHRRPHSHAHFHLPLIDEPLNEDNINIFLNNVDDDNNYDLNEMMEGGEGRAKKRRIRANVNLTSGAENSKFAFYGESAIHIASRFGDLKMIQLLILHGADVNALRPNGDNAEVIAKKSNNKEIASYLHQLRQQNKVENARHSLSSLMLTKLNKILNI